MGMKLTTSPNSGTLISSDVPTALTIRPGNGPTLIIHANGKIEYDCSADEAAELFLKALNLQIDKKFCGERIAKESFYKKIHSIMDNIEGMTKEEIVSYLQEMEADAHKSLTWSILNEKEFE